MMRFYITGLFFFATLAPFPSSGQPVRDMIGEGDVKGISRFLNAGNDVNGVYDNYTLLEMAIAENQPEVARLVIQKGGDVNMRNPDTSLLMFAIYYGQLYQDTTLLSLLIEQGADLNYRNTEGMTPLNMAARINFTGAVILLYEKGANAGVIDEEGNDFFYYLLHNNNIPLIRYFTSQGYSIPRTASTTDGPHILLVNDTLARVEYYTYDSLANLPERLVTTSTIRESQLTLPAAENFPEKTILLNRLEPPPAIYEGVEKILAIGDLHGEYGDFVNLLQINNIIDENLEWAWGKGHLVICGDVFDRGDQVTECLWLIYNLEGQAEQAGGKVHLILGNHELMVARDNIISSMNDKYVFLAARLGVDYHSLFNRQFLLGKWLRSKNTAIKINRILFVHGGIPPHFPGINRTLEKINHSMRALLDIPTDSIDSPTNNLVIEPAWYRGYFEKNLPNKQMKEILNFYEVDHLVVGHTPVAEISSLQNGAVIAINVPLGKNPYITQGLLIEDNGFFIINQYGRKLRFLPGR